MLDSPKSLSELISQIIYGYDEIKFLHGKSELIEKNVFSIQTTLENELKTSASYNERTKLNLDDINEKLANAKVFFNEIESNQAEVRALFTSINNLVIKEAALIKNVDAKITSYTELNAKNTELLNSFESIKNTIILATKTYENDAKLAIINLNDSLNKANEYINTLNAKEVELNNTLESIEAARTNCLQISNEIKEMRKRSQCLMSKAEEIFNKATWFETTLNEYIAKIQTLENNYNLAFTKNEELELKIKDSITTLDKILIALNGRSLDEVLNELKTTNTTLQTAITIKAEIDTIKTNLEQVLAEQKVKLEEYYTKTDIDNVVIALNNELVQKEQTINNSLQELQNNKANKLETYTKIDIDNIYDKQNELISTKANISDVYTKLESDNLLSSKANSIDLEPIKTDIISLSNEKANISDVYSKLESDNLLNSKANSIDLEPIKTDIFNLTNEKANISDVYSKLESDNLLSSKANSSDVYTKLESDNLQSTLETSLLELISKKADIENIFTKLEISEQITELKALLTNNALTYTQISNEIDVYTCNNLCIILIKDISIPLKVTNVKRSVSTNFGVSYSGNSVGNLILPKNGIFYCTYTINSAVGCIHTFIYNNTLSLTSAFNGSKTAYSVGQVYTTYKINAICIGWLK